MAIIVHSDGIEACSHHPKGCPKDCFCPKTILKPEDNFSLPKERIVQPYLSQCTEKGFSDITSPIGFFLKSGGGQIFIPSFLIRLLKSESIAIREMDSHPPEKIPII